MITIKKIYYLSLLLVVIGIIISGFLLALFVVICPHVFTPRLEVDGGLLLLTLFSILQGFACMKFFPFSNLANISTWMVTAWSINMLPTYKDNNLLNSMLYVGSIIKLGVGLVGFIGLSNFRPMHSSSWIAETFALFFAITFYIGDGDHTNGDTPMVASFGIMPRQLTT